MEQLKKYIVTIDFTWSEEMMELIPEHRRYINDMIEEQIIEHYAVSMEVQMVFVTLNAENKTAARKIMMRSPLHKFWKLKVVELAIWDGLNYRLPALQLN